MSKIKQKYIIKDTSTDGLNSANIPANYTPVNYTPTDSTQKGHNQGIDAALVADNTRYALSEDLSCGSKVSSLFTNNGNGSVTIPTQSINLKANSDYSGRIQTYTVNGGTTGIDFPALTDGVTNYVIAKYNSGTPIFDVITDQTLINESDIVPILTIYRDGTHLDIIDWDGLGLGLSDKLHNRLLRTQRFTRESGLALSEAGTRNVVLTSGVVWNGGNEISLTPYTSATDLMEQYYHVGGVWTKTTVTSYNNTQYDNGTNLVTLGGGKYAINWVYRSIESLGHVFLVLGRGNYSLAQAQAELPSSDIPQRLSTNCILCGRIIVQLNASTATQIDTAFTQNFIPIPPSTHNDLAGLQGGTTTEYYHLTNTEHTNATQNASGSQTGLLSPTDWNTFNNKQPALGFTPENVANKDNGSLSTSTTSYPTSGAAKTYIDNSIATREQIFNGLNDSSLFATSYNATNRQLTVIYTAGAKVYVNGVIYNKVGSEISSAHGTTSGKYFFYYDNTGSLIVSATPYDLFNQAPIAIVYYNNTLVSGILLNEKHLGGANGMDMAVHDNLHNTRGTQLRSGGVASGFTLNTNGLANVSYAISAGSVDDEDLVTATAAQLQGGANTYRVLNLTGTSGTPIWTWADVAEGGINSNGTNIYWNQLTGGNWQLTPITTNNTYVNYYGVLVPTLTGPQYIVVMGQTTYGTLAAAQAGTFATDVVNFNLFTVEGVAIYQFVYQRGATFGAPGNARLMAVTSVKQSINSIATGSGTVTSVGLVDASGTFSIASSPITTAGTMSMSLNSQSANTVLAAPNGSSGAPTFRTLVAADLTSAPVRSSGDLDEASFSITNNQTSFANITGFAFANATVRSFKAVVSIYINATASLYESFDIQGIQRGSDWKISVSSVGDASLISFDITAAGQLQYKSGNYAGFVSGTMKFRALTTSV